MKNYLSNIMGKDVDALDYEDLEEKNKVYKN